LGSGKFPILVNENARGSSGKSRKILEHSPKSTDEEGKDNMEDICE
jgi:hypothetical protein